MQLQEFYKLMENITPDTRAKVQRLVELSEGKGQNHVTWLETWKAAHKAIDAAEENTPEEKTHYADIEVVSVLMATVPAGTRADMLPQIEWFKEDLGPYVLGNTTPAHDQIFDTLSKSVMNLRS